jgi:CBS domain-containing protein
MEALTARDVMTREVVTVPDDATLTELVAFLSQHMITGAPVVDSGGRLVGVVSVTDVARHSASQTSHVRSNVPPDFYLRGWDLVGDDVKSFSIEHESEFSVRDIMTPVVFSVAENATVAEMADTMVSGRVHRLLVMNGDRVAGIVTTLDLLKLLRGSERAR